VGSVGHPNRCIECCFHFFGPQGCRAGENCDFCHEFHPRKNAKKNRRLIKRLANSDGTEQEEVAEDEQSFERHEQSFERQISHATSASAGAPSSRGSCGAGGFGRQTSPGGDSVESFGFATMNDFRGTCPVGEQATLGWGRQRDGPARSPFPAGAPAAAAAGACGEAPHGSHEQTEVLRVRYVAPGVGGTVNGSQRTPRLTLVAGIRVYILPQLSWLSGESSGSLEGCLRFFAQPPLPAGLDLHLGTGAITGLLERCRGISRHVITAKTLAVGPGGIALGEVPLSSCSIDLCVADLASLTLCSVSADGGAPEDSRVSLTFIVSPSPTPADVDSARSF